MNDNLFLWWMVLMLVLFGVGVFVLLLWMVGVGMVLGMINDGGGYVGGCGFNGYVVLVGYFEKCGYVVCCLCSEGVFDDFGLLVLILLV